MITIKEVKLYKEAILDEYKDRMKVAEDTADNAETQDDKKYWTGYADGISDAMDVVDKFFDLFINDSEGENNNDNKDLNK